jgi:rRNA large subunit m3Psi methyltransferase RlmH
VSVRCILVAPWKVDPKGPFSDATRFYEERLSRVADLQIVCPTQSMLGEKDATAFLLKECRRLLNENHALFFLDESGRTYDSAGFAGRIESSLLRGHRGVAFCLGGAYGLSAELAALGHGDLISLSPLTLPHELAFTVLLEQVYRAMCIRSGHPYHHAAKSDLSRTLNSGRRK